jgi:hypothetical protein
MKSSLARADKEMLRKFGKSLYCNVFPEVLVGGIVRPKQLADPTFDGPKGNENERREQAGSAAGQGEGTAGRQGQTGGAREASASPSVVLFSNQPDRDDDLARLLEAYPGSQCFSVSDGRWLLVPARIVRYSQRRALLAIGIPKACSLSVQGWAFWFSGNKRTATWIGPRHTNFPHGSICAFEPTDATWSRSDSIVILADLYSVWVAKQLYLETFKRWPGPQVAHWPFERLRETMPGELCGCGSLAKVYADCCQPQDEALDPQLVRTDFLRATRGGVRHVPADVLGFVRGQRPPPQVAPFL